MNDPLCSFGSVLSLSCWVVRIWLTIFTSGDNYCWLGAGEEEPAIYTMTVINDNSSRQIDVMIAIIILYLVKKDVLRQIWGINESSAKKESINPKITHTLYSRQAEHPIWLILMTIFEKSGATVKILPLTYMYERSFQAKFQGHSDGGEHLPHDLRLKPE